jgi:exoribonuclease R
MTIIYGILRFTSKSRVLYEKHKGIEFIEYKTNILYIVKTKKEYPSDRWAKVNIIDSNTLELIEIIGMTCDHNIEVSVLKSIYNLNYRYPEEWKLEKFNYKGNDSIMAYTVDNISTKDRDDAISIEYNGNNIIIGVHIIDLVRMFGEKYITFYQWAKQYISSAYWYDGMKGIFPEHISNMISLTEGNTYPCLSLFLTFENTNKAVIKKEFKETSVMITKNLTYEEFGNMKDADILRNLVGCFPTEVLPAEELVAWCMIQYNMYIASYTGKNYVLRVQENDDFAKYDYMGTHAHFNTHYTHATSPIRRFVDFHNQVVYHSPSFPKLNETELLQVNTRMNEIKEFHRREVVVSLAYMYKVKPSIVSAIIICIEEERMIQIMIQDKRVRIPLCDTYYAEMICSQLEEGKEYNMEIFGIHKNGKATLRIRNIES